jgi:hypothetical protein
MRDGGSPTTPRTRYERGLPADSLKASAGVYDVVSGQERLEQVSLEFLTGCLGAPLPTPPSLDLVPSRDDKEHSRAVEQRVNRAVGGVCRIT